MSTYLVTGANKGIGFAFIEKIAENPDNLVIGTVRDEAKAQSLKDLNLPNVKYVFVDMRDSEEKFVESFKSLKELAPNGIDVFIHNAAASFGSNYLTTLQKETEHYSDSFDVNVVGAIKAYKAVHPYLKEGKSKLAFISSLAGSNGDPFFGGTAYGTSKAALNHVIRQIANETKFLTVAIHPGFVVTDMSRPAVESGIFDGIVPLIQPEESASSILAILDKATEEDNSQFLSYDGTRGHW